MNRRLVSAVLATLLSFAPHARAGSKQQLLAAQHAKQSQQHQQQEKAKAQEALLHQQQKAGEETAKDKKDQSQQLEQKDAVPNRDDAKALPQR